MADRVLLTGATGFVGSHVAGLLAEEGRELRCTVRASSDLRWLTGLEVELVEVDLREAAQVRGALEGVRDVVHVAGVTRAARDHLFRAVNAAGTRRLAEAARRAGVRRLVFVSSLAARGPDGADGPASAYGRSKLEGEERLRAVAVDAGLEAVVLRPGGVYGPRDTDLLPLFRLADRGWCPVVPSSGVVQPIYVRDVARAVVRAVEAATPGFGPWPLAGKGRFRWAGLAEGLGEALGRNVRVVPVPGAVVLAAGATAELAARVSGRRPGFDRRSARDLARHSWTCDPDPTADTLGWKPKVELAEGLARTARWYREAGWL